MSNKVVRVSDDAGVNWYNLPGQTAQFSNEAEQTQDTIFGATYESNEAGLIGWKVSANAYFKGFAGYLAKIMKTTTTNAATGEATTLESGKIYAITNAAHRIMDRSVAVVVKDNGVDHTADVEWIDYLFGRVKFKDAYTVTTPVTIDYSWLTTVQLGKGRSYTLGMKSAAVDDTDYATAQANGGTRTFEYGLRQVNLELGGVFAASNNARADLTARSEVIIEINAAGDSKSIARGFFKITQASAQGDVGDLEVETISATLTVPASSLMYRPFGWMHYAGSTLTTAVQKILTAWLNQVSIRVQYLPQGAPGQSPNDGVDGTAIMTDVSLTGGLSAMNTFTADFQGSGQYTTV